VGKPNEREKDLLFSFKKVYYSNKLTISSQGKIPHSTNKQSQKFCLEKRAQVRTVVRPPPNLCLEKRAQQGTVRPAQYDPATARKTQKNASVSVPNSCLKNRALLPVVRTVRIRTVRPSNRKMVQHCKTENLLGICALFLLGKCALSSCSLSSLKPTLKISLTQLLSSSPVCSSHIPKHVYVLFSFPKKP
jgi:hypothetical protein